MANAGRGLRIGAAIAAAGAAAVGGLSYGFTRLMVDEAINRREPELMIRMKSRRKQPDPDPYLALHEKAAWLSRQNFPVVRTVSKDGTRLIGHLYTAQDPRRIIIAMHGWRSKWCWDFSGVFDFWAANGCTVLFAEQRGQGESGGEYMGFGMTERFDCQAWAQWVNENLGSELPVYLAGISMGASTVLMASGLPLPENVRGIMADCGFTSAGAIWKHVCQSSTHIRYRSVQRLVNALCRRRINLTDEGYSTLEALKTNRIPVLFIHGTDDTFVPVTMTYENYKACTAEKRLFVVPGAEHGLSYVVDPEGYEAVVKDFWNDFDNLRKMEQTE